MNEIPDDKQITDEPCLLENAELIIEPLNEIRIGRRSFAVARAQSPITELAQVTLARFSRRRRILGILRTPKFKIDVATFADFQRVCYRFGKIAKHFAHFGWRFEI